MKILFCPFCFGRHGDKSVSDQSLGRNIDVSHLAAPHIPADDSSLNLELSSNPLQVSRSEPDIREKKQSIRDIRSFSGVRVNMCEQSSSSRAPNSESVTRKFSSAMSLGSHSNQAKSVKQSSSSLPSELNEPPYITHPHSSHIPDEGSDIQQPPSYTADANNDIENRPADVHIERLLDECPDTITTKLSYDIISVREPLAKVLAERQRERFAISDHDYIEMSGDRGSSCFYEEIAGSTTSSTAYDQVDGVSNHNYQPLVHNYAVARPLGRSNRMEDDNWDRTSAYSDEHTTGDDRTDIESSPREPIPGPSNNLESPVKQRPSTREPDSLIPVSKRETISDQKPTPVYSVINKAARTNNSSNRVGDAESRPPQPPPKNYSITMQANISSERLSREPIELTYSKQVKSPESERSREPSNDDKLRLPPPRSEKPLQPNENSNSNNDRPLPVPHTDDSMNNNTVAISNRNLSPEEDGVDDNGYELLICNFEDEQTDVGYEKIRESNRHSCNSLSQQSRPLPLIDNGGYESLQPIYASPSHTVGEPNYEAIWPTAPELAAEHRSD